MIWFVYNRKDFEFSQLVDKIEDEQSVAVQSQKKIKELPGSWRKINVKIEIP